MPKATPLNNPPKWANLSIPGTPKVINRLIAIIEAIFIKNPLPIRSLSLIAKTSITPSRPKIAPEAPMEILVGEKKKLNSDEIIPVTKYIVRYLYLPYKSSIKGPIE